MKLPRFCNEAVDNAEDLSLCDGLACRSLVVNTLVKPHVEASEWFVGIAGLPELPVILGQVRRQYSRVVRIEVAEEGQRGGSGVVGEHVLEGGEVSVLKHLEELVAECSVNITTLVVFSTLFGMLAEERLLGKGGSPQRYDGCTPWVGRADE